MQFISSIKCKILPSVQFIQGIKRKSVQFISGIKRKIPVHDVQVQ